MSTNTLNKQEVKIGFLGLGLMGSRLVQRLHASGWLKKKTSEPFSIRWMASLKRECRKA